MSVNTEPALFTKLGFDPAYPSTFEDKTFIEGPQTARRSREFFHIAFISNCHRHLRGSLQCRSDGDWRHDRCAIDRTDHRNDLRCCNGIFATRSTRFRAHCSRDHCSDSLLLSFGVDCT